MTAVSPFPVLDLSAGDAEAAAAPGETMGRRERREERRHIRRQRRLWVSVALGALAAFLAATVIVLGMVR